MTPPVVAIAAPVAEIATPVAVNAALVAFPHLAKNGRLSFCDFH